MSVDHREGTYRNYYVGLFSQGLKNVSSIHKRLVAIQFHGYVSIESDSLNQFFKYLAEKTINHVENAVTSKNRMHNERFETFPETWAFATNA